MGREQGMRARFLDAVHRDDDPLCGLQCGLRLFREIAAKGLAIVRVYTTILQAVAIEGNIPIARVGGHVPERLPEIAM